MPARAADVFGVTVTSNGQTASRGFNSATQAIDQFKSGALTSILPAYTETSIATGVVNFRGLVVRTSYLSSGTALTLRVPAAGVSEVFNGATRNASQQLLLDYLKKSGNYSRILSALVRSSAVEPLAGNPTSLLSQMVGGGFGSAFATNSPIGATAQLSSANRIGVGVSYGHFTQNSIAVDAISVPLSYTVRFEADPRYALTFDLPITYVSTAGAKTGAITAGVGLTIPVGEGWTITPRIAYGVTGSLDLASAGSLLAGSVTSAYSLRVRDYGVTIGNMVGHAKSLPVSFGSFSVDPRISSTFIKNGLMVAIPSAKLGATSAWLADTELQVFATDTRFFGTALYEDNQQELGVAFGTAAGSTTGGWLKFGVSYLHGRRSNGAIVNFGYRF